MSTTYTKIINGVVVERRQLGDKIERVLNMIPGVTSLPCHDKETHQLKPESPCGKVKQRLNAGEPIIGTLVKRITGK